MFIIRLAAEALAINKDDKASTKVTLDANQIATNMDCETPNRKRTFPETAPEYAFEPSNKQPFKPSNTMKKPPEQQKKPKSTILYDLLSGRENLHTASMRSQLFMLSAKLLPPCTTTGVTKAPMKRRKSSKPVRFSSSNKTSNQKLSYSRDKFERSTHFSIGQLEKRRSLRQNSRLITDARCNDIHPFAENTLVFKNRPCLQLPLVKRFMNSNKLQYGTHSHTKQLYVNGLGSRLSHHHTGRAFDQPLDLSKSKAGVERITRANIWSAPVSGIDSPKTHSEEDAYSFSKSREIHANRIHSTQNTKNQDQNLQTAEIGIIMQHLIQILLSPLIVTSTLSTDCESSRTSPQTKEYKDPSRQHDSIHSVSPKYSGKNFSAELIQYLSNNPSYIQQQTFNSSETIFKSYADSVSPNNSILSESPIESPIPVSSPCSSQHSSLRDQPNQTVPTGITTTPIYPLFKPTSATSKMPQDILSHIFSWLLCDMRNILKYSNPKQHVSSSSNEMRRDEVNSNAVSLVNQNDPTIQTSMLQELLAVFQSSKSGIQKDIPEVLHRRVPHWVARLENLLRHPEELLVNIATDFAADDTQLQNWLSNGDQENMFHCLGNLILELLNLPSQTRVSLVQQSWHQILALFAEEEKIDISSFAQHKLKTFLDSSPNTINSNNCDIVPNNRQTPELSLTEISPLRETVDHLIILRNNLNGLELCPLAFSLIRLTLLLAGLREHSAQNELFRTTVSAIVNYIESQFNSPEDVKQKYHSKLNAAFITMRKIKQQPVRILFCEFLKEPIESILSRILSDKV